jgi:sugar porter (SP) family MFS transporter
MRPNSKLIRSTLTSALGGLLFGFDTVVISGVIESVVRLYALSDAAKGLTVAVAPIGTVLGCFVAGVVGQRLGSRTALRFAAGLYILSALGSAFSFGWPMLLATRFLGGVGIGSASVLGPVYITELSPALWRGRLVGTFQVNVVLGILVGYTSNYLVRLAHLGSLEWRVMVGVAAAPATFFLVALFRIPHSPRWSASQQQIDEALSVLRQMGAPDPQAELADIQSALNSEHSFSHQPVFQWKYRFPLFLAITIGAFNQLAGINAILYYMPSIFAAAGFSQLSGDLQAIAIGATNLVFTLVGMTFIDRFGRKSLLMIGAAGTASCLAGVAWVFLSHSHQSALLALLVVYIAFFALSQGAVI